MANIALEMPFSRYHGKARNPGAGSGLVVFQVGNRGIARARVDPAQPEAAHQVQIRAHMAAAAAAYSALSVSDAQSWVAAAANLDLQNAIGQAFNPSGINLYTLNNVYRLMNSVVQEDTAPAVALPASPSAINSITVAGGNATVNVSHSLATGWLYVQFTNPLPSANRLARANDLRTLTDDFADSIVAVGASPQDVVIPVEYFTINAGDNVGCRVTPITTTYYPGTPYFERNIETV